MSTWISKNMTTMLALLGIGIGVFATVQASALSRKPAAPTAVAVIDWIAVTNKVDEWKEMLAQVKKLGDEFDQQDRDTQKALNDLNQSVSVLPEGSESRQREQDKLSLQVVQYEAWKKYADNKLNTLHAKMQVRLYNKISAAVGNVAERDGWQIVFWDDSRSKPADESKLEDAANLMSRRQVLYSQATTVDITDEVILLMNNEFRSGH